MRHNVLFLSESPFTGKVSRFDQNLRTDLAWQVALEADHISLTNWQGIDNIKDSQYDIAIIILPKFDRVKSNFNITTIKTLQDKGIKTGIMQEGPHWYYQDYNIEHELSYTWMMFNADFILAHNDIDVKYYEGIFDRPTFKMPATMITDGLTPKIKNVKADDKRVMLGGNFTSWYNGYDSYSVFHKFSGRHDLQAVIPSMGRRKDGEERYTNLTHLPYVNWTEWMIELHKSRIGIHLMRTFAAGTFAMNCAYLGIPCIGYMDLDTQRDLHFDTSVEQVGDIPSALSIFEDLLYDWTLDDTMLLRKEFKRSMYYEPNYVKYMNKVFDEILKPQKPLEEI
jgi:hypothetical protein